MKILAEITEDIRNRRNLDVYITVIIAIIISALGFAQIADQSIIASAVLATLALVSVSLLTNRRDNEELQKSLEKSKEIQKDILALASVRTTAERFFTRDYDRAIPMRTQLRTARKAFFLGISLEPTLIAYKNDIEQALENGCSVRFVLIEAGSPTVDMITSMSSNPDKTKINDSIGRSIEKLQRYKTRYPDGRVDVRTLNCIPPYTVTVIDGVMIIQIMSFQAKSNQYPVFELQHHTDETWFKHFSEQLEIFWKQGKSI